MVQPSSIGQVNLSQETYDIATARSLLYKRMDTSTVGNLFPFYFFNISKTNTKYFLGMASNSEPQGNNFYLSITLQY